MSLDEGSIDSSHQIQREKLKISDFELGDKIGAGTFGVIMRATHKKTGKEYALKMIGKKQI